MPRSPKSSSGPVDRSVLRIADANFNRAKEGLRVCEDICRFALSAAAQARRFARCRHRLTRALSTGRFPRPLLLASRDTRRDPGRNFVLGPPRRGLESVFIANIQRVKEATRVLEELTRLWDPAASRSLQRLRFDIYGLEKTTARFFPT